MSSITIMATQVPVVSYKGKPVITTEVLAEAYKAGTVRIRQNYRRNITRFIEGKHFFKVAGQELREFVSSYQIPTLSNKARAIMLWTERGAARHAKMLETDRAWEVFEALEDSYFSQTGVASTNDPLPAPTSNRDFSYALEHISYLKDWSAKALQGRNRDQFLDSVRELEGSLVRGWTEMDEALLHLALGASMLRRWRDVH